MYILRAFAFLLFLAQVILADQPTPILPDPKLTPGDAFDVTAQEVCVPGYARKVRDVPQELKRQVYADAWCAGSCRHSRPSVGQYQEW